MCSLMSHWAWRVEIEGCRVRIQVSKGEQVHFSVLRWHFFFFLVCLLPPTYMLSSFVDCLPAWIWNANNLLSARNILTLFLLSVSPSPLLTFVCLPHFLWVFSSSLPLAIPWFPRFISSVSVSQLSICQSRSKFCLSHAHQYSWKGVLSLQLLNRESNKRELIITLTLKSK